MKTMLLLLSAFLFLLTAARGYGQASPKWESGYGDGKAFRNCRLADGANGRIALFGTVRDQLYFALTDQEGKLLDEKLFLIGKAEIEAARAAGQGYLLAGCSVENGEKRPALWRLDRDGQSFQRLPLPKGMDSGCLYGLAGESRQTVVATGEAGGQLTLLRLDLEGNPLGAPYKTGYQENAAGRAVAMNAFGDIFIAGYRYEQNHARLAVWKFDLRGALIWQKTYGDPETEGAGILVLDNGDVIVSGVYRPGLYDEDTYVLRLAPNGKKIWERRLTGDGSEQGRLLLQTPDRNLLLAGKTAAFGARSSDAWLNWMDKDSGSTLGAVRKGSHLMDNVADLLPMENGDYLVATLLSNRIRLACYQAGEHLCETELASGESVRFSPLTDSELALGDKQYLFRGMLLSRNPLEEWNIRIKNRPLGIKAPPAPAPGTIWLEERPTLSGQHCYFLAKTIPLESGINQIHTAVTDGRLVYEDSLVIYNLPKRPNLHLLSIGIIYGDLNYTDEDANDFSDIFRDQEGRLFEKVLPTVLNTKEETLAYKIVDKILEIKDNRDSLSAIRPEDVLMVFISSHGEVWQSDSTFVLPGSDYRPDNDRTCIRFQKEIIGVLEKMDCKKILFIDACKSGGAKGGTPMDGALARSILQAAYSAPGITTISSSTSNQLSYEHNELKNGLFTAAIKEALTQRVTEADLNSDRIVTLGELYGFIRRRVPELLLEYYNDPGKQQIPAMPRNDLPEGFPLFYINY